MMINHRLQVHHLTHWITASECISMFTWAWPVSGSPNLLNLSLHVHTITGSKLICNLAQAWLPSSHNHYFLCISKLAPSQGPRSHHHAHQMYLQHGSITVSKCISEFTHFQPRSVSPHMLKHGLQVYCQTCSTMDCNRISGFTVS